MNQEIDQRIIETVRVASRFPIIKKVGIFGSYARGEQSLNSDIDILYDYYCDKTGTSYILEVLEFIEEMENTLKMQIRNEIKTDFVSLPGLLESNNSITQKNILNDVIWVYEREI